MAPDDGGPPPDREPGCLPLIYFGDIQAATDARDFVEDFLGDGALSVLFGESGSGKTFFATDLALHVALGWTWRGRAVDRGGVIYVAAEGGAGIRQRVAAFRLHHGLDDATIPFALIPATVNLRAPDASTGAVIAAIRTAAAVMETSIRLVIVDTVSRALAGGNENSSDDLGSFVSNVDRIREATGAHLLLVHHSGKDGSKGARGHSLLRAAADTEIEVSRDANSRTSLAKVTKQRDLPLEGEFPFSLSSVDLGTNKRGKPVTSCVVDHLTDAPPATKAPRLSPAQRLAMDSLNDVTARVGRPAPPSSHIPHHAIVVELEAWRADLKARGRIEGAGARVQWQRLKTDLAAKGVIAIYQEMVWIVR